MGKGKEKKSEWIHDDSTNQFYRVKKDSKGNKEVEWADQPRTPVPHDVAGITSRLHGTTLEDDYNPEYDAEQRNYTYEGAYEGAYDDNYGDNYEDTFDDQSHATQDYEQPSSYKGKEPARTYASTSRNHPDYSHPTHASVRQDEYAEHTTFDDDGYPDAAYGDDAYVGQDLYDDDDDDDDNAYGPSINESLDLTAAAGGSSAHSYDQADAQSELGSENYENFTVLHSREFMRGRIFKMLWVEPKGQPKGAASLRSVTLKSFEQTAYQSFRRFVIISEGGRYGSSYCVPIMTYGGRGCTKGGLKNEVHGIVHDERADPHYLPGEDELGIKPIRVYMWNSAETLASSSRVNYSKICTIEHNTPVYFIGEVLEDDWNIVKKAQKKIWDKANREKKHNRPRRDPDRDSARKSEKRRDDKASGDKRRSDKHGSRHTKAK